ncbi:Exopolysaccharide biosynthesis glycosyltransferase EpsF [Grimontia indica]|uniref:Exopolysaccharide biosynthesis glycosyltransferase EpsF n=1 Tax=Grimontia indica TaxID=1056512 RepID=R1IEA5_9GAMM|nr:glycosyltransferase family 4 protein [Grimontia indica]EOD79081.1 Exopolysaccharide biosynthesis glycosyltransferase EpsF [Grimontia indica]
MNNKTRQKKVLYVIQSIYPEKAGAGINLHGFLKRARSTFDSRVLAVESNISPQSNDGNNGYVRKKKISNSGLFSMLLQVKNAPAYIKHVMWCDIVHFKSTPKGLLLITIIAKILRKKIIQEPTLVGHDDPNSFYKYKSKILLNLAWKLSDSYVFISEDVKNNSEGYQGTVIPRGVELSRFNNRVKSELYTELAIDKDTLVFSQIGRISDRKNQKMTLAIVERVREKLSLKVKLIFIGPKENNPYTEELEQLIAQSETDVYFTGHVDNVEDYLALSDIYLFPSKKEGYGVSVIQALASENITLMSPVGCYKDLEDLGFLGVVDGDTEQWAEKVVEVLSGNRLDFLQRNQSIVESLSQEKIVERVKEFYYAIP